MASDSAAEQEPSLPVVEEYAPKELLEMEKACTGLYFSGHPLAEYDEAIRSAKADRLNDILENASHRYHDGAKVDVFAIVTSVKLKTTKNGQQMAFATIEDRYASMEMIVFPNTLIQYGNLLREGQVLRIGAAVSTREDECKLLANTLQTAPKHLPPVADQTVTESDSTGADTPSSSTKKPQKRGLYLRIPNDMCAEYLRALQVTDIFDGSTPLYIYFTDSKTLWTTPARMHVSPNPVMIAELERRLGSSNVKLVK